MLLQTKNSYQGAMYKNQLGIKTASFSGEKIPIFGTLITINTNIKILVIIILINGILTFQTSNISCAYLLPTHGRYRLLQWSTLVLSHEL